MRAAARRALLLAVVCLAAALAAAPAPAAASRGATPSAAARFAKAEELFGSLKANTRAQRLRQSFTRVLDAYRTVFEKHPGTRQAELALLRAGQLHVLLHRWSGQEGDLNRALNFYERLVETYPKSSLTDDARHAAATLLLDEFKDPARAYLKFREIVERTPNGDHAPAARRQLKLLARHAPPPPAPPPADPLDLSCPAPAASPARPPAGAPPAPAPRTAPAGRAAPSPPAPAALTRVQDIRHWSNPEYTRVVIDLDRATNFYSNLLEDRTGAGKAPRLYVDLFGALVDERLCRQISVNDGILLGVRAGQFTPESVRVVLEIDGLRSYRIFPMQDPFRIVIDITGGTAPPELEAPAPVVAAVPAPAASPAPAPAPASPASGEHARGLGLPALPLVPGEAVPEPAPLPPLDGAAPEPPSPATAAPAPPQTAAVPARPPTPATPARPAPSAPAVRAAAPASIAPPTVRPTAPPPRPPAVPPSGKISLARQLGLGVRRVVIDAGHGAHDPGAPGVDGLKEKDVTLDVALRLREILRGLGYEVVLTRDRDVYLPLEERTALANTARGDLFISVHCNASDAGNLRGVETYYLNLASSKRAMATAARENSLALANMSDLQHLLKEIYSSKMDESSRFAEAVQRALHGTLRRQYRDVKDLGVKQAPFYVLIGAQMPSILAEISFINHKIEGRRLADPAYRQLVAQALADGVKRYVKTVKTAALVPPAQGPP